MNGTARLKKIPFIIEGTTEKGITIYRQTDRTRQIDRQTDRTRQIDRQTD
jgi:hypothetical protein